MPSYFPPQLTPLYGESAASPRSARARFASQIAPKAAASPPLPRYGEAVTRRPPTRGRERGMSGEARAPSGGGRKTRAAVQIRRQAAFGMPSYFPPQLTPLYGESAASPRSARARFASQIAPKAAALPPLPRYGEAVTRRVRRRGGENGE